MQYSFKICDPIHGLIRFNSLEQRVINSRPFQRLRYIRQMGVAYLVYPGANHTRFEHSLGVMELATKIYNMISQNFPKENIEYWRQIVRLAALCHDMGHLPFSHTAEKIFLPHGGHEKMTHKIICSQEMHLIWQDLGSEAENDIVKLAISESGLQLSSFEKLLSQIITEDNFGADRIDYLIRDAYYTGVGYRFDSHHLIDTLRMLTIKNSFFLGVTIGGIQSVESLWIARYMMYSRVYQHPKSRAYTCHMMRFMEQHYEKNLPYLEQTDFVLLTRLVEMAKRGNYDAQVLLKMEPAYEAVPCNHIPDLSQFGKNVIVDISQLKKEQREFPVLDEEGNIISSKKASHFLHAIPIGEKPMQIYVHPAFKKDLKEVLESSQSFDLKQ
ncbi:MAG: HD domain-containing protein [Chlamydiales bacterium]